MNKLFERFVEIVREEAQRAGYRLVPQAPRYLTKKIPIRPDLVLRRGGQDFAVADVKYKELEPERWSHADLYQLLAYCVSLGLPADLLIYATARPLEKHIVHSGGVNLELVGIKMSSKPCALEEQVRGAARRMLEQAASFVLTAVLPLEQPSRQLLLLENARHRISGLISDSRPMRESRCLR